jgi:hypothetical protein
MSDLICYDFQFARCLAVDRAGFVKCNRYDASLKPAQLSTIKETVRFD